MLVAFSSPFKFFTGVKFRAKFKVLLQKQYSVSRCELLEIRRFYRKLSGRQRGNSWSVFHRNSLKYGNDRRGKLDWNWLIFYLKLYRERQRITRHYSAELQTAKQTLTTSKNSIEFTYSDFPCHLKVNTDKLALINRLWKCKKGERWRLPLIHSRK